MDFRKGRALLRVLFVLAATVTESAITSADILFKYAKASPPDKADIGRQFSVQIPEDFLKGKSDTIDNAGVKDFRKIEP